MLEIEIPILVKTLNADINKSFIFCFDKNIMKKKFDVDFKKDIERRLDYISISIIGYINNNSNYFLYGQ